jgi:hypothetical protein
MGVTSRAAWARDLLPAVVVSALAGAVFWSHGFEGVLTRDLGLYVYAGQRVAEGAPPYVDLVNRSGPLSHLAPGLSIVLGRLVGLDDVIATRVAFLLISVAAVLVAHRTAQRMLGSAALAGATALVLVMTTAFLQYASRGPREKTLMVLFVLAAVDSVARARWMRAGFFISLATLTWQPAFFPAVSAALVMLALQPSGRVRGLVRLAVGGLVPLGLFGAWYAAVGHLQDFLDCFVLIHSRHTAQPGLFTDFPQNLGATVVVYGVSFWVLLLGLVATLVAGARAARRIARSAAGDRERDGFLFAMAVGTAVGLLWSVRAYNGWADLFFLFPFALAGVAVVLHVVSGALATWWSSRSDGSGGSVSHLPAAQRLVGVTWCLAALAVAMQFVVTHRSEALVAQRARAETVFAALGPGATAQSIQAPAPLVLVRTSNPTRHQMFSLGLESYVDDVWPGGLDGFAQDLLASRPTLLVVESKYDHPWVDDVLDRGYVRAGDDAAGGYAYFVRSDLDPAVVADVRRAASHRAGPGAGG